MQPEQLVEEGQDCPQCEQRAEPEQDGDVLFFACTGPRGCGAEFGHRRVRQEAACAAGFTVADLPARPGPRAPVLIATTIRRRPE